jgi:hypothetical protein
MLFYLQEDSGMAPHLNSDWLRETLGVGGRHGGSAKASIAALVGMLVVAAAGAILNWSWWLEDALIAPSALWLIVSSRLVVYRQLSSRSGSSDRRVPVVLVVPVLLAAAIRPTQYSGLVAVAAFAVLFIFGRHRDGHLPNAVEIP